MSLKRIISESVAQNPVGLKEALAEELSVRIELALEAKIEEVSEAASEGKQLNAAVSRAEASRQRSLKKAASMVKKGFSHEVAAQNHDVTVGELKKHLGESVEELDEISKSTLGSYINKAAGEQADTAHGMANAKWNSPKYNKDLNTHVKRKMGIAKAVTKLTKEDLDESVKFTKTDGKDHDIHHNGKWVGSIDADRMLGGGFSVKIGGSSLKHEVASETSLAKAKEAAKYHLSQMKEDTDQLDENWSKGASTSYHFDRKAAATYKTKTKELFGKAKMVWPRSSEVQ